MSCPRCDGLMVSISMDDTSRGETIFGWRCLMCGEALDAGIEANRKGHRHPTRSRARVPGTPAASGKPKPKPSSV